ncbi:hypothetical protein Pcinc_017549 [Petrolisthes cinctipes]|uniref:Uncharacterized protein n=1 Tax=Petrolisthes cinctipes TaxID=88211 RepID=A0AAE1KMQ0_PETCI|nr:hypothetical protein Pcinc_017549 [Petrolisthes cinctipes]
MTYIDQHCPPQTITDHYPVGSGIRGESTVKVTGEVMVSGQQRVMVDTLLVSGHEDQCDVTVTLDAYWLVRSEGGNQGREGGRESKEKR